MWPGIVVTPCQVCKFCRFLTETAPFSPTLCTNSTYLSLVMVSFGLETSTSNLPSPVNSSIIMVFRLVSVGLVTRCLGAPFGSHAIFSCFDGRLSNNIHVPIHWYSLPSRSCSQELACEGLYDNQVFLFIWRMLSLSNSFSSTRVRIDCFGSWVNASLTASMFMGLLMW